MGDIYLNIKNKMCQYIFFNLRYTDEDKI